MPDFEIRIKGLKQIHNSLRNYPKIAEPIYQKAIIATGAIFARNTLKNDPVPFRTGNLLQSFRFRHGRLFARWFPTAHYAPFVEFGRGWVFPKKAKVLSWESKSFGQYVTSKTGRIYYKKGKGATRVFAMYSRPAKPKPFMKKILKKSQPQITNLFNKAQELVNKEIEKATKFS